jgi:hypothetical protein
MGYPFLPVVFYSCLQALPEKDIPEDLNKKASRKASRRTSEKSLREKP